MLSKYLGTRTKAVFTICFAVLGLLWARVFFLGLSFPVYTDEAWWKAYRSHFFIDFGTSNLLGIQACISNSKFFEPIFFWPFRMIDALLYADLGSPLNLRLIGIFNAILWLGSLVFLLRKIFPSSLSTPLLCTISLSMLGLGTLPLGLIINRPEQQTLLWLTLFFIWVLDPNPKSKSSIVLGMILSTGVLAYNVRGIFFTPLLILGMIFAGQQHRGRAKFVPAIVVSVLCAIAFRFYNHHSLCPDVPSIDLNYRAYRFLGGSTQNLTPSIFLKELWANFMGFRAWFTHTHFRASTLLFPPLTEQVHQHNRWINHLILVTTQIFYGSLFLGMSSLFFRIGSQWQTGRRWNDRKVQLGTCLLGCLIIFASCMRIKNDYESALILPLVFMSFACLISGQDFKRCLDSRSKRSLLFVWVAILVSTSSLSALHLLRLYSPYVQGDWSTSGPSPSQPHSINTKTSLRDLESIRLQAQSLCQIPRDKPSPRILVDDLTVYAYSSESKVSWIELFLSVVGQEAPEDKNLSHFWSRYRSENIQGLVSLCETLPPWLRQQTLSSADHKICCLKAAQKTD